MGKIKLGKYISEFSQKNRDKKPYPVYSVTNSSGFCTEYFTKDVSSEDKSNYKLVPYGYFAYNPSRINVGSVDCQDREDTVIVSPLYTVFSVSNKLNVNYLRYFFKSNYSKYLIKSKVSGSVRFNLKFSTLCNFEINEIGVEEQEKAVNLFSSIEDSIKTEEHELTLLDELIKSRFNEMFSAFPKVELSQISQIIMGQSPESTAYNDDGIGLPFFQGKADYGEKYTVVKHYTKKWNKEAKRGYVLMSVRAPVGPVNIASTDCAIGRGLCAMNAKPNKANNEFLYNALNSMQQEIVLSGKDGSTFAAINKDQVYKLLLPQAPIELQNDFSEFVHHVDKLKFNVQKRIEKYKELLNKKMDEYFN